MFITQTLLVAQWFSRTITIRT